MPAIVGPIAINSISGGVVNFGDSFYLSPKSSSKSALGSGAGNTGALYTNQELAVRLNGMAELRSDPELARFVKWIRKQPPEKLIKTKKSNERKKKLQREGCFLVIFSFFVHLISLF